jgi:PAS domain S-box-containing protein
MSDVASHLAFLRDPRLAALATSAAPAWLWSTDATRVLWANSVGAAIFGLASPAEMPLRRFDPRDQTAAQIARLLGTLRLGGAARLERLRGFGTGFWRALLCSCSRVTLADHTAGVLVVAMEPAGPALTLAERIRRLYDGSGRAVAAFAADGNLIHATAEARRRLGGPVTLAALGAERLGVDALAHGRAQGDIPLGAVTIERLGAEATTILAATFAAERPAEPAPPAADAPPQPPAETPEVAAPPTAPAEPAAPEAPPVAPDIAPDVAPDLAAAASEPPVEPPPVAEPPPAEEPTAAEQPPAASRVPPPRLDAAAAERRHPLRFVWQMDASGRFTLGSDEFTEVIGPRVAVALGRLWSEINHELALDPENQVAHAVATRDTWSGVTVSWPVDGSADRLRVELSGLPIYDRNRSFLGYRGFGVCRDVDRIATLAMMRRSAHGTMHAGPAASEEADTAARPALTVVPSARNVVPFRSPTPAEAKVPGLSPVERNAFHELARQLTARLKGDAAQPEQTAEPASSTPAPPADDAAVALPPEPAAPPAAAAAEPVDAPVDLAPPPAPDADIEPDRPAAAAETLTDTNTPTAPDAMDEPVPDLIAAPAAAETAAQPCAAAEATPAPAAIADPEPREQPLLDRIPLGVLVYRHDTLLYANRAFLEWTGHTHLDALAAAGGLDSLFVADADGSAAPGDGAKTLTIGTPQGDKRAVEGRLFSIAWEGESALVLMLATAGLDERLKTAETSLAAVGASLQAAEASLRSSEASRQAAEASLQASEQARQAMDASLRDSEALRQAAEASLLAAEDARQATKASLLASEASRREAEASLQATETARLASEASLQASETSLETTIASLRATESSLHTSASALQTAEMSLRLAEAQVREYRTILDTATDGVVVIEPDGRIVSANRSAEALFGYDAADLLTRGFADLFAPEGRKAALDYLDGLARGGVGGLIRDGREFTGQVRQGGTIPLFMTLGRIADDSQRVCAIFRDITPWKKAERDLVAAREAAEKASAAKSDFLAKVSHEIRTPLNSIIGFSEVMLEERFGPIGNERYRDYLKDIRSSGEHVVALINDLLDLAKIEAGKLELAFAELSLNEVVQGAVALMQPLANRERIIIRTSLAPALRPVTADARAVRQVVLNLLSNSIKFTGAGGQVIVSTAQSEAGEILLRVRDTGIGMDEKELGVALEPFRQLATAARWGSAGTGLGLPLTRALAEANNARFTITSKINEGTLVEVAFPLAPVPAK